MLNRNTRIADVVTGLNCHTNGNLLTLTDAKNQTTTYTYDEMDRLKTRTDALSRTESYQYDLNGNLAKFTDRKSQQATFTYDALNRRTGATYPDATVSFGYDAIGRLTSVNDSVGGTITWTYDTVSSGHHPRVQETTTPGTVTVEYDEIGRRVKLSATGQTDVTYTYDKNSRLKTVTQGTQTVTLAYDDTGRRTSLTYPNGVVTSYGYDNANRLLSIDHVKTPTTIEALTYQNDGAGNRIKLTRANAAASLIPTAVSSNSYDAANEQTQFNGVTQTFDANGNLTNDGTNTYTWDARNRLTAISGGITASFSYDGLGRRKSKTIGGTTTGFWYDGNDILAELVGGTPTATYIRSLSIDEPFIRKQTGGDEFYQVDVLGSALALTDGTGTAQTTYTYEPFGKTAKTGASSNSFQYTGREDDGTGLYYYRARYYSPLFQRFVSEDPLEFEDGDMGLYSYVGNNPMNSVDPLGLWRVEVHEQMTLGAAIACGFSPHDAKIIASSNTEMDTADPGSWIDRHDPKHYMPGTKAEAEEIIKGQFIAATSLRGWGSRGRSLIFLGRATHTLQDKWAHEMQTPPGTLRNHLPRWLDGTDADNPSVHFMEWKMAASETQKIMRAFMLSRGLKPKC